MGAEAAASTNVLHDFPSRQRNSEITSFCDAAETFVSDGRENVPMCFQHLQTPDCQPAETTTNVCHLNDTHTYTEYILYTVYELKSNSWIT